MTNKLFLFNASLIPLETGADPRVDPSFPLSKEQYDALTIEDLMQLLREEYHSDPNIENHNPRILSTLCSMLNSKGGVNCVKVHWDGYGVSSRHGVVPEGSLSGLQAFDKQGKLNDALVEETVWSKLDVA